jgi:hypothetical protein
MVLFFHFLAISFKTCFKFAHSKIVSFEKFLIMMNSRVSVFFLLWFVLNLILKFKVTKIFYVFFKIFCGFYLLSIIYFQLLFV